MPVHLPSSRRCLLPLLWGLLFPGIGVVLAAGDGNPIQSPGSLATRVEAFIRSEHAGRDIDITVRPVDERLRLRHCSEPLQADWSPGSRTLGRVTVLVECPMTAAWRVRLQAEVVAHADAWVLDRSVQRGEKLSLSQVRRERIELGGASYSAYAGNPVDAIDDWLGMGFRAAQREGAVLLDRMLEATALIQRGDTVQVISRRAGIEVATEAEALGAGALGTRVRLKNRHSGVVFEATVTGRALAATQ